MFTLIEVPPSVPPDGGSPTNIDIPATAALPMWAILIFMVVKELGLAKLLSSAQEGHQKSNQYKESLTEKVITQVLQQYGELTEALEKLTDKVEALTDKTEEHSALICHHLQVLAERERLAIIAATRKNQPDGNGSAN